MELWKKAEGILPAKLQIYKGGFLLKALNLHIKEQVKRFFRTDGLKINVT